MTYSNKDINLNIDIEIGIGMGMGLDLDIHVHIHMHVSLYLSVCIPITIRTFHQTSLSELRARRPSLTASIQDLNAGPIES